MRLAFYAPMKPPDHPTPSGDRAMARALIVALQAGGVTVDIACTLQARDGVGNAARQAVIAAEAAAMIPDIVARGKAAGWQGWLTYHNYYKAPDLIGPAVSAALGIPCLLVESTRARKRLHGPWAGFAAAAEAATDAANVVFYFTQRDAEALRAYAPEAQHLIHLHPFLARSDLPPLRRGTGMIAVGMMRPGDKLASYALIAETLALMQDSDWRLSIAGDGAARAQVEALMAPFGRRVTFLGALDHDGMERAYGEATVLFWPGVNEAFGLSYLEAQAHGLAVVAQDRPGVRDVLYPRDYPMPKDGAEGLAQMLRRGMPAAEDVRAHIAAHHLLPAARDTLLRGLALAGVT